MDAQIIPPDTAQAHPSGVTVTPEDKGDLIDHYIDGPAGFIGLVTESKRAYQRTFIAAYAPPLALGSSVALGEHPDLDHAVRCVLSVDALVRKAAA